jgi:hypothetical protein
VQLSRTSSLIIAGLSVGSAGLSVLNSNLGARLAEAAGAATPAEELLRPVLTTAVQRLAGQLPLSVGDGATLIHVGQRGRIVTYTVVIASDEEQSPDAKKNRLEQSRTLSLCSAQHSHALLGLGVEYRYHVLSAAASPLGAFVVSQRSCERSI